MALEKTFKALSDENRREILKLLKKESMNAGQIADHFDMSAATVSYHLSILKDAELIFEHKDKNYRIYSLNLSVFEEVLSFLFQFKEGVNDEKK